MIATTENNNDENEEDDATKTTKPTNKHDTNDDNDDNDFDDEEDDNNRCRMLRVCNEWKLHLLSLSSALNTQTKLARFIYIQNSFVIISDFNQHCNYYATATCGDMFTLLVNPYVFTFCMILLIGNLIDRQK